MTGSACPIGASAKADALFIIHNQIILINLHSGGTAFPRSPSHSVGKLTFVIADRAPVFYYHAHAHAKKRARAHV